VNVVLPSTTENAGAAGSATFEPRWSIWGQVQKQAGRRPQRQRLGWPRQTNRTDAPDSGHMALLGSFAVFGGTGGVATPTSRQEPRRRLAVVPLIGDKRYYGETPGGPAGQSGAELEI
jgi:hypothetical protein